MRPFIVCHMMESLDGRIDCAMTEKLEGSEEYYSAIKELEIPTVIFGRVTAAMEVTSEPPFSGDAGEPCIAGGLPNSRCSLQRGRRGASRKGGSP
ncbi:MAG: hypothetical protein II152_05340 [Succinivibrionaceae bacterium]|nr:hypothetical protein [Succinivibrionaceae bacterium]